MEQVYESYVARNLKKVFEPEGWTVTTQAHGRYLFEIPQKQFALRPDLVIHRQDRTIVMDTKWKRLTNNPRINYGISQADMYQMYAYSKKYGTADVWLLYPMHAEVRMCPDIIYESSDGARVHVWVVDVADISENMRRLLEHPG